MIDALYLWIAERWTWMGADGRVASIADTPLRLFHFSTFRMVLAFLTAFLVTYLISPRVIAMLYRRNMRDTVRVYDECFSQSKTGTPTMGGLIIIGGVLASALLWCNPTARPAGSGSPGLPSAIPLLVMTVLFYGGIGAIDDVLKIKRRSSDGGLSRRMKLVLQTLYASLFAVLLLADGTSPLPAEIRTQLYLPGIPANVVPPPDLAWVYFPLIVLAFLGISNAINFADGLDGLAVVPSCLVVLVLGVFAYVFSHAGLAAMVRFEHVPGMTEVAVFATAVFGAGIGFLWFNSYPAQIFMGDTGSMAIGGLTAALAVLTKTELLFLILGGIFVYEFVSVFIQDVVGIRRLGRRLLFRAPAHHAFQHQGVAETKVVLRFWIVSFLLALLSLATLKLR
jgi:phospho-N-acetylmuramoyl-pentapeptide-transferase